MIRYLLLILLCVMPVQAQLTNSNSLLATSANQASQTTVLQSIDSKLTSPIIVSGTLAVIPSGTTTVSGSLGRTWTLGYGTDFVSVSNSTFATSAKQDTGNTYLQSIENNTSSFYALTDTQLRASLVGVSETRSEQIKDATEGTWNEAIDLNTKLTTANSLLSSISTHTGAGSGAGAGYAKSEDEASTNGDLGVPSMAIRSSSPSNTSTTVGDYEFLQMNNGRLYVDSSGTSTILNSIGIASGTVNATILNSLGISSGTITSITNPVTTSGTTQLTAGSAMIGAVSATIGTAVNVNTHAVTGSGTFTTSGTQQLTAGNAVIGSISNTGFNATVLNSLGIASGTVNASILNSLGIASGTLTSITNTVTTSGTTQLTAGTAMIGAVSATIGTAVTVNTHAVTGSGTFTTSGTQQLTAGTAAIGSITNTSFGATQVGTWLAPSGTTTVSGTAQLTAGTANIGSILNTTFGATQVGTWNAPSGTTTTSGTTQLTAGTAMIGAVSATIGTAVTVNTHAVTGSGTFTTSGTQQITAGTAVIGSLLGITSGIAVSNTVTTSGTSLVVPTGAIGDSLSNSDTANVPKVSVKGSAGRLYLACFFNGKSSTQYMQIFDSASQPAANTAPVIPPIVLASGQSGCIDYNPYGKYMSSGIYVANSTSATAYVNGTSDTIMSVQYK